MVYFLHPLIDIFIPRKHRPAFFEAGFYSLAGLFTGIALNDIWKWLSLPGNDVPIKLANGTSNYDEDFMYQTLIGAGIMVSEAFGIKHGLVFGTSLITGALFANTSEKGEQIAVIPFVR